MSNPRVEALTEKKIRNISAKVSSILKKYPNEISEEERAVLGRGIDLVGVFRRGWLNNLDGKTLKGEQLRVFKIIYFAHRLWVIPEDRLEGHVDKYLGAVSNVMNRLSVPNVDLTRPFGEEELKRTRRFFSFIHQPPNVI